MADVRNSISLTDRASPVLMRFTQAVDRAVGSLGQLDNLSRTYDRASTNSLRASLTTQKNLRTQHQNQLELQERRHLDKLAQLNTAHANKMKQLSVSKGSSFLGLGSTTGLGLINFTHFAFALSRALSGLSDLLSIPDTLRSTQARLGLFSEGGSATSEQLMYASYKTALDTRSGYESTADLATRLLISDVFKGENAGMASVNMAGLINKTLIAGGGSAGENERALLQLSQGLSSGVLQGDELRAIREQTPYLASIIAQGLAKIDDKFIGTTIGNLKDLGAEGELTAERIVKAFLAMEDDVQAAFEAMPKTFNQSMTNIKSTITRGLQVLAQTGGPLEKINNLLFRFGDWLANDDGIEAMGRIAAGIDTIVNLVVSGVDAMVDGIKFLSDHLDILEAAAAAVSTVIAVALIGSLIGFLVANWQVLLAIVILTAVFIGLNKAGVETAEVVGAIVGALGWLVATIWNIIISLIQGGSQIFEFIVMIVGGVASGIIGVITAVNLVFETIIFSLRATVVTLVNIIMNPIIEILGYIETLSNEVSKMTGGSGSFTFAKDFKESYNTVFNKPEYTDYKTFKDTWDKTYNQGVSVSDYITDIQNDLANGAREYGRSLDDSYMHANNTYLDLFSGTTDFFDKNTTLESDDFIKSFKEAIADLLSDVDIAGGYLDGIKDPITLSDEDLAFLRDVAMSKQIINMNTLTPNTTISFGDVHETADADQLIDVIEEMIEEAYATSLVY